MHHSYFFGDISQVECFFDRCVTATHDRNFLIAVKETVTGGAGRNPLTHKGFFRRQAQVTSRRASGNDQRIALVLTAVAPQSEGTLAEVNLVDVIKLNLGLEALGVLAHALHQVRTLQTFNITRPVIHFGRGGQLTAHLHTGDQ